MINLLPDAQKSQLFYARLNTKLRRWIFVSMLSVAGIIIIFGAGFMFIHQSISDEKQQVNQREAQLKSQKLEETQKRMADISDSIKLASDVLSKQVLFSKLLNKVGGTMPPGTSLQSLSINSLDGGIDLTAVATNYQSATQVQLNLADPANKIFEKADIVSITCQDDPAKPSDYPCQVTIRALFAKENTFQYSATQKAGN